MKKLNLILHLGAIATLAANPLYTTALTIDRADGWLETATAQWQPVANAAKYIVKYSGEGLSDQPVDHQLIRRYPDGLRVDIPGLKAGSYTLSISALDRNGNLLESAETSRIEVKAHTREGFAFAGGNIPGAYKADGTLKDNAEILYVTSDNAKTITFDVVKDKKGNKETRTGICNILELCSKGYEKRPLAIRFIGAVIDTQMDALKDGNYLNFQGNNTSDRMIENITLEGIGNDAALYGYGVCLKRAHNIEIRNVAILLFGDDGVSMDTDNSNIWVHNVDFFYGKPGKDADQVKGDGSIDMKTRSTNITISNNHFFDSGKVMGCGGATGESINLNITYHHNWFDHCDSRCPRLHYVDAHIYNNYYDGVSVYGIGNTSESNALIENNYFRAIKRPMMIAGQGTDIWDKEKLTFDSSLKGTFSNQDGGINKACGNVIAESPKVQFLTQNDYETQFDAWVVDSRDEKVPETAKSLRGGWAHTNFDTADNMYLYTPDNASDVPEILKTTAGRLEGGDITWSFDNSVDDEHHDINQPLKDKLTTYTPTLLAIQSENGFAMSAIIEIAKDATDATAEVYDLHGRLIDTPVDQLPAGLYIIHRGNNVTKTIVR